MASKKILVAVAIAALIGTAFASPRDTGPSWDETVQVGECRLDSDPILDIEQDVKNDKDTGPGGAWAHLNYTRHVRVWQLGPGKYCAVVEHEGRFTAIKGASSPGGNGALTGEETGQMRGGYRAIITGSMNQEASPGDGGSFQTVNYGCGIQSSGCQDRTDWTEVYFGPDHKVEYDWWAWIYDGGSCGTWTNSGSGNNGDVLCG